MRQSLAVNIACAALLGMLCLACGRHSPERESKENLVTDCMCAKPFFQLSQAELRQKTVAAERGDTVAQKDLWDYYLAHNDLRNATYWEDRLVVKGDGDATVRRSETLFNDAYHLGDSDARKLALLKQALDLEARARKARAGTVLHVMINGKYEDIRRTGQPDKFTKNMQALLGRVQAAQR